MLKFYRLILCFTLTLAAQTLYAKKPAFDVLATGSKRIVLFDPDFNVKWEYPAGNITVGNASERCSASGRMRPHFGCPVCHSLFTFTQRSGSRDTFPMNVKNGNAPCKPQIGSGDRSCCVIKI
jgi:hypothetical protein